MKNMEKSMLKRRLCKRVYLRLQEVGAETAGTMPFPLKDIPMFWKITPISFHENGVWYWGTWGLFQYFRIKKRMVELLKRVKGWQGGEESIHGSPAAAQRGVNGSMSVATRFYIG